MHWLNQLIELLLSIFPRLQFLLPNEAGIRVTLGSRVRSIGPGYWWYWPLVQQISYGCVAPQVLDLPTQTVWTKDGKQITISLTIRFSVVDIEKALLKIHDFDSALQNLARGAMAEYINQHTLEECSDLGRLMQQAEKVVQKECRGWGLNIQRLYVDQAVECPALRILMNMPNLVTGGEE